MLTCTSPGQFAAIFSWAPRKSWSRPGFTRKRTTLKAVMACFPLPISTRSCPGANRGTPSRLIPGLHDHLARDLSAFQVDHGRAEHLRSVGVCAALREGETVSGRDAGL